MLLSKPRAAVQRPSVSKPRCTRASPVCSALHEESAAAREQPARLLRNLGTSLCSATLVTLLACPPHALAEVRLPPIDTDPNRCERGYVGNTIGQANAVSDKLLDLRGCKFDGKSLAGKTLSGALMVDASFKGADLSEAVMSKAYAVSANFDGASFKNAVLDRVIFNNSSMKGVSFVNAVITGSEFEGVDLTGANFEDALIGQEDTKRLCGNPTVKDETRFQEEDNDDSARRTQDGIPRRARTAIKRPEGGEVQAVSRARPGNEEQDVAEALFDLLGSAAAKAEDEEGPEGAKRKRSRPTKREDQEELTLPAAPAGRKSAADGGGGARKLDRRTDAADAARRGMGSAGVGGSGRADGGLRANGRGIADAALARAGLANASLPQLPFPLFPGLAPGLGYIHHGSGWPQAFGAGAGVDGSMAAQQLLLPPRRFKHCASHVYIAHFIDHQQQQQRFQFFQQQMSAGFPSAVAPPDAAALAAAAGDGRAAAGRDGPDLASRRMPPAPSVAPFGLMSGFDRAGAAAAPALAAAQLQQQYAQLQHSFALMHSGGFPLQFPAAAASLATLSAQQAAAARPLSHFYAPPFGFPGGMLPSMALMPPPAMRAPPAAHPPHAEAATAPATAPDAGHAQQAAGAAAAATTDAGQANAATPAATVTEITVAV